MSNSQSRKCCCVPMCSNSTKNAPEKLFFLVPFETESRQKWMQTIRRAYPPKAKSSVYCCEDHFDIENDMDNYVKYKLVGGIIKIKKGVVPHKFECQDPINYKPGKSLPKHKRKHIMLEKVEDDPISSTSDMKNHNEVIEDPLGNTKLTLEKSTNHEVVQITLTNKDEDKARITIQKYLNKKNNKDKKLTKDSTPPESDEIEGEKTFLMEYMEKAALMCISKEPNLLLGIPQECYFCINILSETTHCTPRNLMITLKKIRLHQSNAILALDFGLATSLVDTIIRRTIPAIASSMKSLINFPCSEYARLNLPVPFRKLYVNVESIVDCFEIKIEKPVNAVHQALTFSNYKRCNTIKYLISTTPDGLINFISEGYGGQVTDSTILEDCGILQALPKGAAVLTDRDFEDIAQLLQQHEYTLIKPSIKKTQKRSKKEIKKNRNIRSLMIQTKRTITQLQSFGCMLPHACVNLKEIDLLDNIVFSACGIVNLQSCLFSTK